MAALAAGLEGIRDKIDPRELNEDNLYAISEQERQARGIDFLPQNLLEVVEAFDSDPFVEQTLGKALKDEFVKYKLQEWNQYHLHVSQWEIERYSTIFLGAGAQRVAGLGSIAMNEQQFMEVVVTEKRDEGTGVILLTLARRRAYRGPAKSHAPATLLLVRRSRSITLLSVGGAGHPAFPRRGALSATTGAAATGPVYRRAGDVVRATR
nr:glutamine synthetase [Sodalis glossinidius]